jgi:hypothetical protein
MDFARRFLEARGAVLEETGARIHALLPGDLARTLEVPEMISLVPGSQATEADRQDTDNRRFIHLGSPLLDQITRLAAERPPLLHASLSFHYLKSQGFAPLVDRQFTFHKARLLDVTSAEIVTRYLLLTLKYTAHSDEEKEGLLDLALNLETGAPVPDMVALMPGMEKHFPSSGTRPLTPRETARVRDWVSRHGPDAAAAGMADFRSSMNRRFARDWESLQAYYAALGTEMRESLSRGGISDKLVQERKDKIALLPDELLAKQNDLVNRYTIRVRIAPAAALLVSTPAVRVLARLAAGNRKKEISLTYNPVLKALDSLVCPSCGSGSFTIGFCDGMHPVCFDCLETGCKVCGKGR